MVDQSGFHNLVSGQAQGPGPTLLRGALRPLAWVYGRGMAVRTGLYRAGLFRSYRSDLPVICVGNLTTGGTGKTPLAIWLCRHLIQSGLRPAILTRGYKTGPSRSDEPGLFERHCPGVKVIVNPDRSEGARSAAAAGQVDVLVMDDGFQHLALARDLDIVALDATCPFGHERLLPAGLLREPIRALARAGAVVLTRTDQVSQAELEAVEKRIIEANPSLVLARTVHAPAAARFQSGPDLPIDCLRDRRVLAFCGIGNPQAFFKTLEQLGVEVAGSRVFNDHHHCSRADIEALYRQALDLKVDGLLTTEKNFFDVAAASQAGPLPLGYLAVDLAFETGEAALKELIAGVLACRISGVNRT